jgi:hypothetical protein
MASFNALSLLGSGYPITPSDLGDELLYSDGLVYQSTYFVRIKSNGTPGPIVAVFSYLFPSEATIIPYAGADETYPSSCQTFKCRFRPYASGYVVNRWSTTNSTLQVHSIEPGGEILASFSIPPGTSNVPSTITSVGKFMPANINTGINQYHPITVDVLYNMQDAAGNPLPTIVADGKIVRSIGMESENVVLRAIDRYPTSTKNAASGTMATDRTICGATYYQFELNRESGVGTGIFPVPGFEIYKSTPVGGSRILNLGGGWSTSPNSAGVGNLESGYEYLTRIRPYFSVITGNVPSGWGSNLGGITKIKTMALAGMPIIEAEDVFAESSVRNLMASVYPNPSLTESALNLVASRDIESVVMFNNAGQIIARMENLSSISSLILPTPAVSGLYWLVVTSGQETVRLPLLIQ